MSFLRPAGLLLAVLTLVGCATEKVTHIASIYIEAPASTTLTMRKNVKLPVSGISIPIMTKELTLAEDLLSTTVVEAGPSDLRQVYLLVHVNTSAARNIMDISRQARGKNLVLVVNDTAVGILPIEQQINDGKLMFAVEQKGMTSREAALFLSDKLNASTLIIRKELEQK
ncbi:MAG: hypothetical protein B9S29_02100 [Opitutia bacterium Tous-C2FEB]|jgi:hypothetical protein|nr:MAG: hypothetical protein B9S29_02100 [Opitutae bacterium Tous-C2FEB]PAZ01931.1 MAG: hypothetical protein CAK89_07970 [Opitutae bacterium AMD-G3]